MEILEPNRPDEKNHHKDYIYYPSRYDEQEVLRLLEKYQFSVDDAKHYPYGTAGFRYKADLLAPVMIRVGIMISLYATIDSYDHNMGIMITASHNDESYNGCKLIQSPDGNMVNHRAEELVTYLVNERNNATLWNYVKQQLQQQHSITKTSNVIIHIGRDTREHSNTFYCLLCKVIRSMGCGLYDHGIVTTPILHHCVKHHTAAYLPSLLLSNHRPYITGYYHLLLSSYLQLRSTKTKKQNNHAIEDDDDHRILYVDCACGVGYMPLLHIAQQIQKECGNATTKIIPYNAPQAGPLNSGCGSEYVQKDCAIPKWYGDTDDNIPDQYHYAASIDGDGDRIVFFYTTTNDDQTTTTTNKQKLHLLDGDKISALIVQFIKEQWNMIQYYVEKYSPKDLLQLPDIRLGVVQTSYANGASTRYIQSILGSEHVLMAKTGVKYVHHMTVENFDIGIYFEANGHGTVLFQSKFYQYIYSLEHCIQTILQRRQHHHEDKSRRDDAMDDDEENFFIAYQRLRLLPSLVNQAVGDAMSDLLLIDVILYLQNMTISQWDQLYCDYPSKQCKVVVPDRTMIHMNENETQCVSPIEIQQELNVAMNEISSLSGNHPCRTFIRPSGTEDVVRIYAEAINIEYATELANRAMQIVTKYCIANNGNTPNSKM